MTTALASPVVSASRSSFFRTRQRWGGGLSPRAHPPTVPGPSAQALDVLGGFLADDVDDVVHGDDPQESAVAVHHGHRHDVVLGDQPGDFLLVGPRRDTDDPP